MDFLNDIILPLASSPWIYVLAMLLVILDGFFPLFPSETVVVGLAALAASTGAPDPFLLLLTSTLGAIIADNATYLVGRRIGRARVEALRFTPLTRLLHWADKGLETRPGVLVLVARFIPWARLAVNLTAGTANYPYGRFIPLCISASTLWALYNVAMGYLAGQWFGENPLLGMVLAVVLAVIMGILLDAAVNFARRRANLGV